MTAILNKKILLSISALAFASVVIVSATGAFFTDEETSDTNVFTAGTLELDINANGTSAPFITDLGSPVLNPGEKTGLATISIKNGGSTNLIWFGYFNTSGNDGMLDVVYIDTAKMEFKRSVGADWEPADQFILNGDGNVSGPNGQPWNTSYQAIAGGDNKISLREWNNASAMGVGNGVMNGALKPGGYEYRFTFSLGMMEDVPNALQGATLNMNYTLNSTQVTEAAIASLAGADARISVAAPVNIKAWAATQLSKQF